MTPQPQQNPQKAKKKKKTKRSPSAYFFVLKKKNFLTRASSSSMQRTKNQYEEMGFEARKIRFCFPFSFRTSLLVQRPPHPCKNCQETSGNKIINWPKMSQQTPSHPHHWDEGFCHLISFKRKKCISSRVREWEKRRKSNKKGQKSKTKKERKNSCSARKQN